MKASKAKSKILHLGGKRHESSSEKDLELLVDERLVSQQSAQLHPQLPQENCEQQVKEGDSASLLCLNEIPPRGLHPVLGPPIQERHWAVEVGQEEGHEYDQRAGTSPL